jgi:hypothetical protein
VRSEVLGPLICLVAKRAAWSLSSPGRRYSMHTTEAQAESACLRPTLDGEHRTRRAIRLFLRETLPTPGPNVPFADILNFKEEHAADLARLRVSLNEAQRLLGGTTEPDGDLVAALLDEAGAEAIDLSTRMRRLGWRIATTSLAVTATTSAFAAVAPGATPWVLSGVGVTLASSSVALVRDRPTPRYFYLHEAAKEFT